VNLEDPMRRSPAGYDTRDLQLDVVIRPDGSCEWKDEEDFAEMCRLELITPEEQRIVRDAGERVIEATARGDTWWREWDLWEPDPAWTVPTLGEDWDVT
jgi:predicted RNA-binding protein associated with RNAse of E/G family